MRSFLCAATLISAAHASWGDGHWGGGDGDPPSNGCPPWWSDSQCNGSNGNSDPGSSTSADPSQYGLTESSLAMSNKVIVVHAVLACLVWVLFIPLGGILLRLGLKSRWILRLHAFFQVLSYITYVAAVALGIWLVRELSYGPYSLWENTHVRLGLAILAIAFVQPILGYAHHMIFKKRVEAAKAGRPGKKPARTTSAHFHIWIGRSLIVLGMINGGLGIQLAANSPFTGDQPVKGIAYGVCCAVMFVIYFVIVIFFERRKMKQDREYSAAPVSVTSRSIPLRDIPPEYNNPPSYIDSESQESLRKEAQVAARYR